MPRMRISESSDESDSDIPLSIIGAQSIFSDETHASLDDGHVRLRHKNVAYRNAEVRLAVGKASEGDGSRTQNVRRDQLKKNGTKQRQLVPQVKREVEEDVLDEKGKDDIPLSTNMSRLSKSKRPKREKKEPKRVVVESESCHDDQDDEEDIPLALRLHQLSKQTPKVLSKRGARNNGDKPRRKAPSRAKKRARGVTEVKRVAKRQRTAKEEDVSARKFEKAGQRRETPGGSDPSRLFYESMYNEKLRLGKRSSLAEQWMLRHGLLEDDVAQEVLEKLAAEKLAR